MKIQFLGFLPAIILYVWSIWYFYKHWKESEPSVIVVAATFIAFLETAIIVGLGIAWGISGL